MNDNNWSPRSYTCPCESVPPLRTRCPDRIGFPRDWLGEMSVKDKLEGSRRSQGERAFRLWCRPDACEERREDRLCRKSLWPQHSSKKVSTKLRESSLEKIVHWKSSTVAGISQLCIPRMLTHCLGSLNRIISSVILIWTPTWIPGCNSWHLSVTYALPPRPQ